MTHKLFVGFVITSTAGTYTATITKEAHTRSKSANAGYLIQGIVVASLFSSFFGFKEDIVLQPGSRVLCVEENTEKCYILGVIPDEDNYTTGDLSFPNRTNIGAGCATDDAVNRLDHLDRTTLTFSSRRSTDTVDGEYVVGNELGVLLGLYQELATLKASELAQVQCFLLDDLVRIISHNFQHYTALGEYNIYHDGKSLMAEFGATHKPGESYGRPAVESDSGAPVFEKTGTRTIRDEIDFFTVTEDERIKAIERFKLFLGSVGDFLHLFVVRPDPSAVRILNAEQKITSPDTGLCNLHIGTDGGFHLRSVKEVFLEKTNWIRVPLRTAVPDDPKGDENVSYSKKSSFAFDNSYKYKENPFNFGLQIRDYVTYVNEKLNYQNFKSHEKDFFVNDNLAKEKKIEDIDNVDQETTLGLKEYKLRTAGIYLMPNGGITIRDAWNSAIVMEGGNIYIQPAKDLVTQPLRNYISKVGGNYSLACDKNIDISSTSESMRIKTHKILHLYSDDSGVLIESNGEKDIVVDESDKAIEEIGGIVLKSKLHITNYADKNIVGFAKEKMLLQALMNIDITAERDMSIYGRQSLSNYSDGRFLNYSKETSQFMTEGSLTLAGKSNTAIGNHQQPVSLVSKNKDTITGAVKLDDILKEMDISKILKEKQNLLKQTKYEEKEKFEEIKFRFLSSEKYKLEEGQEGIPYSLAQQDDLVSNIYSLSVWEEKEINDTLPYPGKDLFDKFLFVPEVFENLEKSSSGFQEANPKKSVNETPAKITLKSLLEYKVQK